LIVITRLRFNKALGSDMVYY